MHHIPWTTNCQGSKCHSRAMGQRGGNGWTRYFLFRCEKSNGIISACWTYFLEQRTIWRKVTLQRVRWLSLKTNGKKMGRETPKGMRAIAQPCSLFMLSSIILIAILRGRAVIATYKWPTWGSVIYILISAEPLFPHCSLVVIIHPRPCRRGENGSFLCSLLSHHSETPSKF